MKNKRLIPLTIALACAGAGQLSCTSDIFNDETSAETANGSTHSSEFDPDISGWSGQTADDAAEDIPGTDEDFYHEANIFSNTVTVTYSGETAEVTCSTDEILYHTDGAYVTIDMQTNTVSGTEIILTGSSDNGGLKIYGTKKFKLTLAGLSLVSQKGPAINIQDKKRIFVHLQEGTTNSLTDTGSYSDDTYYIDPTTASDEDRKGCFFSEGNLIFSGTGILTVSGKYKHGIATDGYLVT